MLRLRHNEKYKITWTKFIGVVLCALLAIAYLTSNRANATISTVSKNAKDVSESTKEDKYSQTLEENLDRFNKEMRKKYPPRRAPKRHIGFFGALNEKEQKAGVKIVFPW